ncbi:hypothetical protein [Streptacidiphilus rugosus]|uniref:hypothetical protein n=1 Tax=Streptacidiphilus rugosus TaxID=405783 RepID=UPI0012FAB14E|nr:hypothetical protein [Streptacidiphilus rugosus]
MTFKTTAVIPAGTPAFPTTWSAIVCPAGITVLVATPVALRVSSRRFGVTLVNFAPLEPEVKKPTTSATTWLLPWTRMLTFPLASTGTIVG